MFFFFNDTATTEIYTLSLHDALPISPGAAHRVQRDCELSLADPFDTDRWEPENGVEMPLDGSRIRRHLPRPPPSPPATARESFRVLPYQVLHALPIGSVQKDPIRPDELERVPFNRIMARAEGDPAAAGMGAA